MAKPKAAPATEAEQILQDNDEAFTGADINPALNALYSQMGMDGEVDATVHVYLIPADGRGPEARVWQGSPDEYDLADLARQFGSGTYRVKIYVRNPDGFKPLRANKLFAWKLSPADEAKRKALLRRLDDEANGVTTAQSGQELKEMMASMMAGFQSTMISVIERMQPAQTDPLKTLDGVRAIAAMFKPEVHKDSFQDTLKSMQGMIALAKDLSPAPAIINDDGDVKPGALLARGIDAFTKAIDHAKGNPAPIQSNQPEGTQAMIEIEKEDLLDALKTQLRIANKLAQVNDNPEDFAELAYDMLPEDSIISLASSPTWFTELCNVDENCKPYESWYAKVREAVIRFAREDGLLNATGVENAQ